MLKEYDFQDGWIRFGAAFLSQRLHLSFEYIFNFKSKIVSLNPLFCYSLDSRARAASLAEKHISAAKPRKKASSAAKHTYVLNIDQLGLKFNLIV